MYSIRETILKSLQGVLVDLVRDLHLILILDKINI